MSKGYTDLNKLLKDFQAQVVKTTQNSNSLHKSLKKIGEDSVEETVYSYDPRQYKRTGQLKDSWEIDNTPDGIVLHNTREENGRDIVQIIESGEGYQYSGYGYEYEKPRRFVEHTRQTIKETGVHIKEVKNALRSSGYDVK